MRAQKTRHSRQARSSLGLANKTAAVRGSRLAKKPSSTATERIDVRVSPEAKKLLMRATELLGSNLTAFVLESAQERAAAVIERYERLRLSDRDRDKLLAALENPPAPTKKLLKALQASAPPAP